MPNPTAPKNRLLLHGISVFVLLLAALWIVLWANQVQPVVVQNAHNLLGTSYHVDTATATVTRGDLIVGNATPKWDRLILGSSGTYLNSDGIDANWATPPFAALSSLANYQLLSEKGAANGYLPLNPNTVISPVYLGSYYVDTFANPMTVDWSLARVHEITLTNTTALTFANIMRGNDYKLHLIQDGTGTRTVAWTTSVTWSGGVQPVLSSTPSARDILSFTGYATGGVLYMANTGMSVDVK